METFSHIPESIPSPEVSAHELGSAIQDALEQHTVNEPEEQKEENVAVASQLLEVLDPANEQQEDISMSTVESSLGTLTASVHTALLQEKKPHLTSDQLKNDTIVSAIAEFMANRAA